MKWKRSADYCECSDILDLLDKYADRFNIPISEKVGCVRSITCDADLTTYVTISLNASEIVRPDDNYNAIAYVDSTNLQNGDPRGPLDIFSFTGMSCEKKKWYTTRYPHGLSYYTKPNDFEPNIITGDLDGKKSEILFISCRAPR